MGCGSSAPSRPSAATRAVQIRYKGIAQDTILIHPDGVSEKSHPLYTAIVKNHKPHIRFYQGPAQGRQQMGEATYHSWSTNSDITVRGQSWKMKYQGAGMDYYMKNTPFGEVRWRDKMHMRGLELVDRSGNTIARTSSSGLNVRLEIYANCSDAIADLIILSYLTVRYVSDQFTAVGQ